MTAKSTFTIPEEGSPAHQYVRKVAKVTVGYDSTVNVNAAEAGTYTILDVSEPVLIFGVWTQCATAFTTNWTITLGDTSAAALFMDDTTINPASSGATLIAATGGVTVPLYKAADEDITATVTGTAVAGLLNVYIDYAVVS